MATSESAKRICIRDATRDDVAALASIRHGEAVHRDKVSAADGKCLRYLVVAADGEVVGFGCVVLSQPRSWPRVKHFPQIIDLFICPERRGRGLGEAFIRAAEGIARNKGMKEMWIAVEPERNPRALALYERLGYQAADKEPVEEHWEFVDSDGVRHSGTEWLIRMRKELGGSCA